MLVEFSIKVVYSTMCITTFQIYGVHIPRKCIESSCFYSCSPSSLKTLSQVLIIAPKARGKYSFRQATFFRKSVLATAERGGGKLSFALSKFRQKIWRWLGTLDYLYFVLIGIFQMWWFYIIINNIYVLHYYK